MTDTAPPAATTTPAAFTISDEHNDARLEATITFAGVDSVVTLYNTTDEALVQVVLASPCGAVTHHKLTLTMKDPIGGLVTLDGVATKADWKCADGKLVASGAVTDQSGDGPFILQGTRGTQLYAGGRAVLGTSEIT